MANKTQVTFPLNNVDYQAEDMQLWHSTRTNGVFSDNGEFLTTVTSGRNIQVSPGRCWMSYERFRGIIFGSFENTQLTVDIADGIFDRIDRVVIRYDVIANETKIQIKKGVPASNPVAPILERNNTNAYEIGIADIRVPKGALTISQGMITDKRLDESLCGVMRDGVTGIPTDGLQIQFQGWFNSNTSQWEQDFLNWYNTNTTKWQNDFDKWFNDLKVILDGDVATNLASRILALETLTKNLPAANVKMNNGEILETKLTNLQTKVDNGQNWKLTNDDGRNKVCSGQDANTFLVNGFWNGNDMTNMPNGSSEWWYLEVISHASPGYCYQKATQMLASFPRRFYRTQINGSWNEWRSL